MKTNYSESWKASIQPRKQRKHLFNAPLHRQTAFFGVHLSKDLRVKFARRSITIREGDTVKVMRGQHKGKTGKVRAVNRVRRTLTIDGVERPKRDGSKSPISLRPSNLMVIDVASDKRRSLAIAGKVPVKKSPAKKGGEQ